METIILSPCGACEKFIRCKMEVIEELEKLGLHDVFVDLGSIGIREHLTAEQRKALQENLSNAQVECVHDRDHDLVESIEKVIVELVYSNEPVQQNYSIYISKKLSRHYTYLASQFMKIKGVTIQQYMIHLKIERAKELLAHDHLTLTEVSYLLNYSSVSHLSKQFHDVTGIPFSQFRGFIKKKEGQYGRKNTSKTAKEDGMN